MTRVLITRSLLDSKSLALQVQSLGATPICVPLLERKFLCEGIRPSGTKHDWIVLTSRWAVQALSASGYKPSDFGQKIAVVGPITAQEVRDLGDKVHFMPSSFSVTALVQELNIPSGMSVYYPRSALTGLDSIQSLIHSGVRIMAPVAYTNTLPLTAEQDLTRLQPFDYALVCSGSAGQRLGEWRKKTTPAPLFKVIAIGPATAKACLESNLPVHQIAKAHTTKGLLAQLESELPRHK